MEKICAAHEKTLAILGKAKHSEHGCRLLKYCVQVSTEDGVLLFNLLTREMVLLSGEEASRLMELDYLREHWFVVPEELNDREIADMVRWVRQSTRKKSKHITGYTILPTMDCNARCFYCYEKGRPRTPMSEETARKAAQYIKMHCGGETVKINWFGGEPLYNLSVIDLICDELHREQVDFSSFMISNGYLFDASVVEKAAKVWNLKHVQITLDGTERVYNRSKAYIYREGSAYQVVLGNMARLLNAGIRVFVRMNLDLYNAEDLMKLADELAARFAGKNGLQVYAHLLFDDEKTKLSPRSDEEWTARYDALRRLNDKLERMGLSAQKGLKKENKLNHCMADSGSSVVIFPRGDLGVCEHYSESDFVGHLDREGFDSAAVAAWKKTADPLPECEDCFYYPACYRLKKCDDPCFAQRRQSHLQDTENAMRREYRVWCGQEKAEEHEELPDC